VAVVQVGEQCGLIGFPAEGLAGDQAGRRIGSGDQSHELAEVSRQHQDVNGNAHGRQVQAAADGLGDVAKRDAFVVNRVPVAAGRTLLQRQAEQ